MRKPEMPLSDMQRNVQAEKCINDLYMFQHISRKTWSNIMRLVFGQVDMKERSNPFSAKKYNRKEELEFDTDPTIL